MKTYTLVEHALERLEQRTSISPENINELLSRGIDLPYDTTADRAAIMFWSPQDDRAYLAFYNKFTREVVTIFEAYKWVDGVFRGKIYTHRDMLGRTHGIDLSKIRRADVRYLLARLGLPPRSEFDEITPRKENPKPGTGSRYAYEWVLRANLLDASPFVRVLMRVEHGKTAEADLNALARAMMSALDARGVPLTRVKEVIYELREPARGKNPPSGPIEEIELDYMTLKDMIAPPSEHSSAEEKNHAS